MTVASMMSRRGQQLLGRPAEVVAGQQPQRDDLDLRLGAPGEQVDDVVSSGPMAVADTAPASRSGPSAIAVEDDADMAGPRGSSERPDEPPLIDPVDQIPHAHDRRLRRVTAQSSIDQHDGSLIEAWLDAADALVNSVAGRFARRAPRARN